MPETRWTVTVDGRGNLRGLGDLTAATPPSVSERAGLRAIEVIEAPSLPVGGEDGRALAASIRAQVDPEADDALLWDELGEATGYAMPHGLEFASPAKIVEGIARYVERAAPASSSAGDETREALRMWLRSDEIRATVRAAVDVDYHDPSLVRDRVIGNLELALASLSSPLPGTGEGERPDFRVVRQDAGGETR